MGVYENDAVSCKALGLKNLPWNWSPRQIPSGQLADPSDFPVEQWATTQRNHHQQQVKVWFG
jgi:hypothetical protein